MNNVFTTCHKCEKEIKYGNAYVTIVRNVEQAEHILATGVDEIEVIDSNEIITLCGTCGNRFNSDTIVQIINAIPNNNSNLKSN
jgi:hypothetical protein